MKNKSEYRVVQISDEMFRIEVRVLWFWINYYETSSRDYATRRCKQLEDIYRFKAKTIYPTQEDI